MTVHGGALVTGAGGFLGARLVRALVARGERVHALVPPSGDAARLADLLSAVVLHRADVTDAAALEAVFAAARPDGVFHLAARGVVHGSTGERETLRTSVLGTANVLAAARGVRVVHLGSSTEYGPRLEPLREDHALAPLTFFGAAKAAATLLVQQHARSGRGPTVVLRSFTLYGPGQPASRLIPAAIRAALSGEPLPLTPRGLVRDLVYVDDVAEACLLAAAGGADGEVVNVGTGRQTANEEVVALIGELLGRRIETRPGSFPPRAADRGHWVADVSKARALLGWEARHALREGLEKTVALHLDRVAVPR